MGRSLVPRHEWVQNSFLRVLASLPRVAIRLVVAGCYREEWKRCSERNTKAALCDHQSASLYFIYLNFVMGYHCVLHVM